MRRYNDFAIDLAVDKMAEIFNKKSTPVRTASVLLQAIEIIQQLRRNASPPPNEPLTLEELREMDGEPVWVECLFNENLSSYVVIDRCDNGIFTKLFYADFEYYGDEWLAYRRKPEEVRT